eukprot:scaffold115575_cov62-Attheya_sp.AAC.2
MTQYEANDLAYVLAKAWRKHGDSTIIFPQQKKEKGSFDPLDYGLIAVVGDNKRNSIIPCAYTRHNTSE